MRKEAGTRAGIVVECSGDLIYGDVLAKVLDAGIPVFNGR